MPLDISSYDLDELAPNQIAALWQLELLSATEFPRIAMHWLEGGADSDAIAILAGETSPTICEHSELFERALVDAGGTVPSSQEDAYWVVIRLLLRRIASEQTSPFPAAIDLVTHVHWREPDLKLFVRSDLPPVAQRGPHAVEYAGEGLAIERLLGDIFSLDDIEDHEKHSFTVAHIERDLREEAARILSRFYATKPERFPASVARETNDS